MTKRDGHDPLSGIRIENPGDVRFLSGAESSFCADRAQELIARVRPDIDPDELMPVRALELDKNERLLEYGRQHGGIPFYRGPHLFLRMDAAGELLDLQTDWTPCRFESPPTQESPSGIHPPEDASCLRAVYALDVSSVRPFYLFPPRAYDREGRRIVESEKLGPWEWIDLRGSGGVKRSPAAPIRPLQGRLPAGNPNRSEPLERDELRRVRGSVLDYLLRSPRPRAYRWAFLAGRERSSFQTVGSSVHVRVYRLVHGIPVLGACLDLYVDRRTGRLSAVSDELQFRRVRLERFAEAFDKPRLAEDEAWQNLRGQIRVLPYYVLTDSDEGEAKQASLIWIEESEFVCDAFTGQLVRAEIIRL